MSNIRNMDSWVHKQEKEAATEKAMDMVWMAVEKARRLTPLEVSHLPLTQSALVIGGGIAGMTAAAALADQGFETHLVEQSGQLGGMLNDLETIAPAEAIRLRADRSQGTPYQEKPCEGASRTNGRNDRGCGG